MTADNKILFGYAFLGLALIVSLSLVLTDGEPEKYDPSPAHTPRIEKAPGGYYIAHPTAGSAQMVPEVADYRHGHRAEDWIAWDRAYPGHLFGVPYMSEDFIRWATEREFDPIIIGWGYDGIVLSVSRHTAAPVFVWPDGSEQMREDIRVKAHKSKLAAAEALIRKIADGGFTSLFLSPEGCVMEYVYQILDDNSVVRNAESALERGCE